MIGGMLHVAISVSNLDEALAFYRDALGMEVVRDLTLSGEKLSALVGLEGATIHNVALQGGGAEIQLLDFVSPKGKSSPDRRPCDHGLAHVAFRVDDVQAMYDKLKAQGVKINSEPTNVREGGGQTFYCMGPDNVVLEFIQVP